MKTKPQTPVPLMTEFKSLTLDDFGAYHDKSTDALEVDSAETDMMLKSVCGLLRIESQGIEMSKTATKAKDNSRYMAGRPADEDFIGRMGMI